MTGFEVITYYLLRYLIPTVANGVLLKAVTTYTVHDGYLPYSDQHTRTDRKKNVDSVKLVFFIYYAASLIRWGRTVSCTHPEVGNLQ